MKPPKMYVCGFPKSGIHAAERIVLGMFEPMWPENNWYGTNAWDTERRNLGKAAINLAAIRRGSFIKGHTGYLKSLEALLVGLGIGLVFVWLLRIFGWYSPWFAILSIPALGYWVNKRIIRTGAFERLAPGIGSAPNLPGSSDQPINTQLPPPQMISCPHCSIANPEGYAYCQKCGEPPIVPPQMIISCPHCSSGNPKGYAYCQKCGEPPIVPPQPTTPPQLAQSVTRRSKQKGYRRL